MRHTGCWALLCVGSLSKVIFGAGVQATMTYFSGLFRVVATILEASVSNRLCASSSSPTLV
jgi:hypothetical protein